MKKKNKIQLIIALVLCLVSIVFAGAFQTDFGKVSMSEISLETEAGTLTGYLFRPAAATASNPVPAIVCSHGYLNNREMQDANYVELARRGYVVIAMNAYAHGDSEVAHGDTSTPEVASGGMIEFVRYLATLPYVDKTQIGVTGHSMGGGYTVTTMTYFTELEEKAFEELSATLPEAEARAKAHELNLVNTGVIVGNYPSAMAQDPKGRHFLCNCNIIVGKWDEFFAQNALVLLTSENTQNLIRNLTGESVAMAENGKVYTGADGYTLCLYNPNQYHATNHFSVTECRYLVDSFNRSMPSPIQIPSTNQTWWLKEGFNLLGLIGFFLFIVPMVDLLLSCAFFRDLRQDGKLLDAPQSTGKYVGRNIWQGIICFLLILPLLLIGYVLLINPVWPQDTTGGIGLWSVGCGLIALLFVAKENKKATGKKLKESWEDLGVKIGWKKFGKTLLLALIVVALTFTLVFLADGINQTDFRIWSFDIRVFTMDKVWVALRYLPFFAVYYIFASLGASRSSFKNWSEGKQMAVTAAFSVIAPALMLIVTYLPTVFLDQTLWVALFNGTSIELAMAAFALIPILMIPFVPILAIASCISVRCYRLTNSIWLGGLINTLLITMITVANTSFSFPY